MQIRIKKIFLIFFLFITLAVVICGGIAYKKLYSPAFKQTSVGYLYIDERKDFQDLMSQLKSNNIKDAHFFEQLASAMKYKKHLKSGRYKINPKIGYLELVRMLRSGKQIPVNLTFNNIRVKEDFAERISSQLMFDSDDLLERLNDSVTANSYGFTVENFLAMFIPNTYQIYWNISIDNFLRKMKKEYDTFWTEKRMEKANDINLSPVEISILASIVEEETVRKDEYPVVAGLYLNRLKKGMLLQADPTVKFAVGDFSLKRILNIHLSVDSPYNTYKNKGLPPGIIRLPSIPAIESVLNFQEHNYLYMCAKEDFSGSHNFAVTLSEHSRNARRYQEALNRGHIW
ncbi:MAG: endolytic transglycosylase MltG [Dysgonamonadaceae bacterium]|nr:endolytic transglycosylase MltG [Dysgonamonadaceae bacterium]